MSIQVKLYLLDLWPFHISKINMDQASNRTCHLIHQPAWLAKINIFRILANFCDFYRGYFIIVIKVRNDRSNQCLKRCGRG